MRIYKRTLIPATIFFILICFLSAFLPLSGANWREVLTISGNIESIVLPPPSQTGTTLSATKTATGFVEEREGITVFGVRGEICVANGGERPTEGLAILDTVQSKSGPGQFQDYVSQPVDVSAKPILEASEGHCYPYEFTFVPIEGEKVKYRNTVSVTILNHSGWLPGGNHCVGPDPCPFGPNPKTDFTLPEAVIDPIELLIIEPVLTETPTTVVPTVIQPQVTEPLPTVPPPTEQISTEPPATEPPPSELPTPNPTEPPPTEAATAEPPPTEPPPTEAVITEPPPTESP
jgi:hypothetical protein